MTAWHPNDRVGRDVIRLRKYAMMDHRCILLLVDYLTKQCQAISLKQNDVVTVTDEILDKWILNWGHPDNYI